MRVNHLPKNLESVNDVVHLSWSVETIMQAARKHKSFLPAKKSVFSKYKEKCAHCSCFAKAAHHKKPVWACAVEFIMGQNWQSEQQLQQSVNRYIENMDTEFTRWNLPTNLIPLCAACHTAQQSVDDRDWKLRLSKKYRLVYTIGWCNKHVQWGEKKNEQTLAEYADCYLRTEIEKLYG